MLLKRRLETVRREACRITRASCTCTCIFSKCRPGRKGHCPLPTGFREWSPIPVISSTCHVTFHVLCGHYHRAVQCSERSIAADGRFLEYSGTDQFYMISICHDFHMMMYAAMMSGRMEPAIQAANGIVDLLAPELLNERRPHLAAMLEGYLSTREHVLVRFGLWETLVSELLPEDPELHCVTTAMHHYAKGVAHASLRQFEPAKRERAELEDSVGKNSVGPPDFQQPGKGHS